MSVGILHIPSNRAHAGDQTDPIGKQNEDEDGSEIPERSLRQMRTDDALKKVGKASHHPFPEVLRAFGDPLHVTRGELGENDQAQSDGPGDDHRIGDRKAERPRDLDRLLRQTVFFFMRRGFVTARLSLSRVR